MKNLKHILQGFLDVGNLLLDHIMTFPNHFHCCQIECYRYRWMLLGIWLRLVVVIDGWVMLVRAVRCLASCIWSCCCGESVKCDGGDWIIVRVARLSVGGWDCFIVVYWR